MTSSNMFISNSSPIITTVSNFVVIWSEFMKLIEALTWSQYFFAIITKGTAY